MTEETHADDAVLALLADADLEIVGRIAPASNLALLARIDAPGAGHAIVKPIAGERPLWDFPDGTLAAREVASYWVSRAAGFDLVPPTILRAVGDDVASVQAWAGDPGVGVGRVARLVPGRAAPTGWLPAFSGLDESDRPVLLVHEDAADVRRLAVLDVVLNQADRKGAHLGRDGEGRLWAFDQGLCLHAEPKLRTILWGWAGEALLPEEVLALERLLAALDGALREILAPLLTEPEVEALRTRTTALLADPVLPVPGPGWPSIPWPPL